MDEKYSFPPSHIYEAAGEAQNKDQLETTLKSLPCLVACLWASATGAGASTVVSPEGQAMMNIVVSLNAFESGEKRLPRDWKELSDAWQLPLDEVFPKVRPTVRYEYFNPPLVLRAHGSKTIEVLAITRKPMAEITLKRSAFGYENALKGPGRYMIRREPGDPWGREWFDEAALQRIWPTSGRALPLPDAEPEPEWIGKIRSKVRARQITFSLVGALVVIGIAFSMWRRLKSRW